MTLTPALARLVQELGKLPGIGEKTATRLALFILGSERDYVENLAEAIWAVKAETSYCQQCFSLAEGDLCLVCRDPQRSEESICVVEEPADQMAVERAQEYRGRYHVLHGVLAPLDGVGPEELKIAPLLERLRRGHTHEVIIATNPTVEGEATALYLAKLIKPLGIRVSRIAHGIPMGGDVEYIDAVTLGRAIEGRREM
ncbi:MAG: recombination protein RecR [Deltaproteobacteria bacterium]|nr:recombination protein RecR [Deltaproteobacteria bacterium]